MIVGYLLHGNDNGSFMMNGNHPETAVCSTCGLLLDFNYHNPFFRTKIKAYDFSHPYDIGQIVSLKFKEFCLREKYANVCFKEFELEPYFFQLIINDVLEFDIDRANTEFGNKCNACGYHEYVVGFEPSYLKNVKEELKDGFYRTDILFGSYSKKNPIIIVGTGTYQKLKREKFRGLIFDPVYS